MEDQVVGDFADAYGGLYCENPADGKIRFAQARGHLAVQIDEMLTSTNAFHIATEVGSTADFHRRLSQGRFDTAQEQYLVGTNGSISAERKMQFYEQPVVHVVGSSPASVKQECVVSGWAIKAPLYGSIESLVRCSSCFGWGVRGRLLVGSAAYWVGCFFCFR
jgi:hypothetical protein